MSAAAVRAAQIAWAAAIIPCCASRTLSSDFDLAQIVGTPSGVAYGTPAPNYMSSIVGSPGTSISVGDYGAGHIVVSTAPIAANINSEIKLINGVVNLRANTKYDSDLKILANMIAWSSSAPTQGANSRRTNSTGERVGGQLGEKWTWTNTNSSTVGVGSGAVIYKGLVFYVDSSNILHAFDRDPSQNLLNGPTATTECSDFLSLGTPYDEVFNTGTKAILSGRVSTPTVASTNGNATAITSRSRTIRKAAHGDLHHFTACWLDKQSRKLSASGFTASGSGQLPSGRSGSLADLFGRSALRRDDRPEQQDRWRLAHCAAEPGHRSERFWFSDCHCPVCRQYQQ